MMYLPQAEMMHLALLEMMFFAPLKMKYSFAVRQTSLASATSSGEADIICRKANIICRRQTSLGEAVIICRKATLSFWNNFLCAAHIGSEGYGDIHGAVGVKVIFEECDEHSWGSYNGVVEGVRKIGLSVGALNSDLKASCLRVAKVGA